jgi:Catalase
MTLHPQERITTFEQTYTDDLLRRLKAQLIDEHPDGLMPRDAHPKMHGLVQAEFIVHADIPAALKVGVFERALTYAAWVRFSNASGTAQPDAKRDIRGMAIKLVGVAGATALSGADVADGMGEQDFLLISTDVFLCRDLQVFDRMVRAIQGSLWDKLCFFAGHPGVLVRILSAFKTFANPLTTRYFSSTPYLLGEAAVKYCATPMRTPADVPAPSAGSAPGNNFMRDAMQAQLRRGPAEFSFGIQLQSDAVRMPVEDAATRWDENLSPFVAVATLRIAQQDFDNAARNRQGEDMRFSPWHGLAAHRPIGSINRARRVVYHGISALRRRVNGVAADDQASTTVSVAAGVGLNTVTSDLSSHAQ